MKKRSRSIYLLPKMYPCPRWLLCALLPAQFHKILHSPIPNYSLVFGLLYIPWFLRMLMTSISDKLIYLTGIDSMWRNPLIYNLLYCFWVLLHTTGPALLEWLQRATAAGCNIQQFSSAFRDEKKAEMSSSNFFK